MLNFKMNFWAVLLLAFAAIIQCQVQVIHFIKLTYSILISLFNIM